MGSSAITDDPKSSGVAEAPGTCKYKDCEFVVSGKLKRSKIEQRMQAHINKHHGEASKDPDLQADVLSEDIPVPIPPEIEHKESLDHIT